MDQANGIIVGAGPLPATTTHQEDLTTLGQRKINLIWEFTQAVIAVMITGAVIFSSVRGIASSELTNSFFLIIGFYFSRTNHTAIGGVGAKIKSKYEGR